MGFLKRIMFGDHKRLEERQIIEKSEEPQQPSSAKLTENVEYILNQLHHTSDLKIRIMKKGNAALIYLESLVDQRKMQESIFSPIEMGEVDEISEIPYSKKTLNLEETILTLLRGHAIYLEDGSHKISQFNVTSTFNRSVEEPDNEKVVRGSHDGFVENLMININLVRKRIEHRDLTVRYFKVGKKTNTNVALIYLEGVCDPSLLQKVEERIKYISSDMILVRVI